MKKQIEHRVTSPKFEEERKAVFLKGYYNLKEAEIKELEENKVLTVKPEENENV